MGTEITIEEIQNKFNSLPEDLKRAIISAKVDEKITEIGKLYSLNIEQLGQLSLETHLVMLGYTHADKFEDILKKSLNLPDEKNRQIAVEINNKILKQIKENLMSKPAESTQDTGLVNTKENTQTVKIQFNETNQEEEEKKDIQNKKIMESILSQKLSGSFQAPAVKTEYSLNNLSKKEDRIGTSISQNGRIPIEATIKPTSSSDTTLPPSYSAKEDPYRIKPE